MPNSNNQTNAQGPKTRGPDLNSDNLHESDYIDLKKVYPMSYKWAIKKTTPLAVLTLFITLLVLFIDHTWISTIDVENESNSTRDTIQLVLALIVLFAIFGTLCRWAIYVIEKSFVDYKIIGGNFHMSKGVFLKHKGSFPLSRITDIYLERGYMDLLFGLYSIHISTPTVASGNYAFVHGLTESNAQGLREKLEEMVQEYDNHIENIDNFVSGINDMNTRSAVSKSNLKRKKKIFGGKN